MGYYRLFEYLPAWIRKLASPFVRLGAWVISYVPRFPKAVSSLSSRPVSAS
jgi:cellulose synthase (UDP-forming)